MAVDGSELSFLSLDYALSLAKNYSAEVMALTVVDIPSNSLLAQGSVFTPLSTKNYKEKLINYHKKILEDISRKAKNFSLKTKFTTKLLEGRPADKIVETANLESFDFIVIGSRGLGEIKKIFFGRC
ncbi:MAG: universal stress protein [Candidatus Bathyarchaeota archaeon]|nr:MAG: universal stress protein [Candidatus Bathyarchaeum tardum]WNZ28938.1 MAG: universal stress protein [Candidatus Bathyarchaeota archaeon]